MDNKLERIFQITPVSSKTQESKPYTWANQNSKLFKADNNIKFDQSIMYNNNNTLNNPSEKRYGPGNPDFDRHFLIEKINIPQKGQETAFRPRYDVSSTSNTERYHGIIPVFQTP